MKPRTCGQCRLTQSGGDNAVWCFGVPPQILNLTETENGNVSMKTQGPLIPRERPACSLFKRKWRWPWVKA